MSRRESELLNVREERKENAFPFSLWVPPITPSGDRKHQYLRTPFVDDKEEERVDELTDGLQEVQEGELRVKAPEEVPWIGD